MSQISRLLSNYRAFVGLPWQKNLAGNQRVWFAVYYPSEERRLRAQLSEFEVATKEAKHGWRLIDITKWPEAWLNQHQYREAYFKEPIALGTINEEAKDYFASNLKEQCLGSGVDENTVVAVIGTSSLFGFTTVSSIISEIENSIKGRLLVFFPGEYERNHYRFMEARDGFNYMAVPITCSERLLI